MITLTHKFRLYPNKQQNEKLLWTLNKCRETYNFLLSELQRQKVIDRSQIQGIIPDLKICEPELKQVYSKTLQYECYQLFSNLKALSQLKKHNRKIGRLRFKGTNWFKTFTYNQSGFKLINGGKRCQLLHLSKIGDIKIRCHRNINGKIKQITVKRESSGKWFALIIEEKKEKIRKNHFKQIVGIDLGLENFIYDSEKNKIKNPRHLNEHTNKLIKLQRKLSKKQKKSKNRIKARVKVAKQYEKIINNRNDFLHKLSRFYANNYDVIVLENLQVINLARGKYLSKSIYDASWSRFRQFLTYKAESAGKLLLFVDPKGTTKRCSQCGNNVKKEIWHRTHKCSYCNLKIERDYNSALEIKKLGLQQIGQGLSKFKPVEIALTGNSLSSSHQFEKQEALLE
ncbi:MAG: transposase [Nanoarchaeota archaeon]|nr:transposase [Nanoarchaeota archaeon]